MRDRRNDRSRSNARAGTLAGAFGWRLWTQVTGRPVEDWAAPRAGLPSVVGAGREPCLSVTADLGGWAPAQATPTHRALAAWQVRLDTYLARSVAFRQQPPGTVPVAERNRAAAVMCDRIRAMGMPCAVYQH